MHALPGDTDRLRELLARGGPAYPGACDWRRIVYAVRNSTREQRERAERLGLDVVFVPTRTQPVRLDHDELPVVRAVLDVLETGTDRVLRKTRDTTELAKEGAGATNAGSGNISIGKSLKDDGLENAGEQGERARASNDKRRIGRGDDTRKDTRNYRRLRKRDTGEKDKGIAGGKHKN